MFTYMGDHDTPPSCSKIAHICMFFIGALPYFIADPIYAYIHDHCSALPFFVA